MHGLGNDYIYVNCFDQKIKNPAKLATLVSDRHFGVGADGLILISRSRKANVKMRIFNADGSEAEMCGNGIRCVAKYACEHNLAKVGPPFEIDGKKALPASLKIETKKGVLSVGLFIDKNKRVETVCVNMGKPVVEAKRVGVNLPVKKVIDQPMQFQSRAFSMTCVSMGNPHAVFFKPDLSIAELEKFGPIIENHSIFPNRINVHFVKIEKPDEFTMRTWERGSGLTLACGTGACAACVAAVITNRAERQCTAHLPGGDLQLNWSEKDDCVYMTGPAVEVFQGDWPDA